MNVECGLRHHRPQLRVDIVKKDGQKVVTQVKFTGGCNGNTQGVAKLVEGMEVNDAISRMEGINVYFKGSTITAIVRYDGIPVYVNGEWNDEWADQHIRVAVSEFIATTDRKAYGLSNPLCAWASTSRLLRSDVVDAEGAIGVLKRESAANDGLLFIDTAAHLINRTPKNLNWHMDLNGKLTLESGFAFDSANVSPWANVSADVKELVIKFGLKSIPDGAFSGCTNLTTVRYEGTSEYWNWINIQDPMIHDNEALTIICTDKTIRNGSSAEEPETPGQSETADEGSEDPSQGEAASDDGAEESEEAPDGETLTPGDETEPNGTEESEGRGRSEPMPERSYSLGGIFLLILYCVAGLIVLSLIAGAVVLIILKAKHII